MAEPLAIYGAAVGSVAALGVAWNIYNTGVRHRAKVSINVSFGYPRFGPLPGGPSKEFVLVTAANTGRRPITLQSGGLLYPDRSTLWFSGEIERLPRELRESQTQSVWGECEDVVSKVREKGLVPSHAFFRDGTGKLHKTPLPKAIRSWLRDSLREETNT